MTREEAKLQLLEYCPQLCGNEINAFGCNSKECEIGIAIEALKEPEIVHCKDCVYWKDERIGICGLAGYFIGERGYCLYGKAGEQE